MFDKKHSIVNNENKKLENGEGNKRRKKAIKKQQDKGTDDEILTMRRR
jgi:hypothetical protein